MGVNGKTSQRLQVPKAGSIPATSTNFKNITMKYLYQELDELLNTIKYSDERGLDDLYDNLYFEDILETCKEIAKYIEE